MASIVSQSNGRRLIQLSPSEHPKRPKIRLGKVTKREAESARVHVESLLRTKVTGLPVPPVTAAWLANAPDALRRRLAQVGLVALDERKPYPTLAGWVRTYIEGRTDIRPNTLRNMEQAERSLTEFFGTEKRLNEINAGDAEDFRIHLKAKGLAEGTIRRRCKRVKQFFSAAIRRELIAKSPFEDMKCGTSCNPERFCFVSRESIQAVMEACPDIEWRMIFALA